jgi:hypothetical protein
LPNLFSHLGQDNTIFKEKCQIALKTQHKKMLAISGILSYNGEES